MAVTDGAGKIGLPHDLEFGTRPSAVRTISPNRPAHEHTECTGCVLARWSRQCGQSPGL